MIKMCILLPIDQSRLPMYKKVCPLISWWKKIVDIKFAKEDCNVFVFIDQWLKTFIGSSIDEYHFHGKYCFFIT